MSGDETSRKLERELRAGWTPQTVRRLAAELERREPVGVEAFTAQLAAATDAFMQTREPWAQGGSWTAIDLACEVLAPLVFGDVIERWDTHESYPTGLPWSAVSSRGRGKVPGIKHYGGQAQPGEVGMLAVVPVSDANPRIVVSFLSGADFDHLMRVTRTEHRTPGFDDGRVDETDAERFLGYYSGETRLPVPFSVALTRETARRFVALRRPDFLPTGTALRNPGDEDLRALERAAQTGGKREELAFDVARLRRGLLPLDLKADRLAGAVMAIYPKTASGAHLNSELHAILQAVNAQGELKVSFSKPSSTKWGWQRVVAYLQRQAAPPAPVRGRRWQAIDSSQPAWTARAPHRSVVTAFDQANGGWWWASVPRRRRSLDENEHLLMEYAADFRRFALERDSRRRPGVAQLWSMDGDLVLRNDFTIMPLE